MTEETDFNKSNEEDDIWAIFEQARGESTININKKNKDSIVIEENNETSNNTLNPNIKKNDKS